MQKHNLKNEKKIYLVTLLIMIFLMAIFANSFYWPYDEFSHRKMLILAIVLFGIVVVPILAIKISALSKFIQEMMKNIKKAIEKVRQHKKRTVFCVCFIIFSFGLAYVVTYFVSLLVLRTAFNVRFLYVVLAIMGIVSCLVVNWKSAAQKPEKIFAIFAIILGLFCIGVTPDRVGISWDDQIHYGRTLEISNFLNGVKYEADIDNIGNAPFYQGTGYDRESDSAYIENIEAMYATRECQISEFKDFGIWSFAYIPSAVGIILARGFGLSYIGVFNMGRLFNLLMYIGLVYFAIKRIKYGKVLVAAIGMIPTTIFMAASYSYDPWIIGFTILGFAYFFAELQDDEPLQNKNAMIMIGAITIGCLPKAIYFPLLFPLLFMPKRKFKSKRQRTYYYLTIVGLGVLLVATFLLPILISGAGTGDVRGGADVNSTEQIKFILENPFKYVKILYDFGLDYIAFNTSAKMLQGFAYAGLGHFYSIVSMILTVLAFLDKGEHEKNLCMVKSTTMLANAAAMILASTALYISFTAVGSGTIAGMQGRYLIPTIYPALYSIGIGGTTNKINKNAFVCVPLLIIGITFIYNMTEFCVINY